MDPAKLTNATKPNRSRREELDGLRALAIFGVMYTHFVNDDSVLVELWACIFFARQR